MIRLKVLLVFFFATFFAIGPVVFAEQQKLPSKVVLVVIDTLRADHLPIYGYKENTAPFMSSLGEKGAVFERALSTSSWTSPATASIHTGLYPFQHGVVMGMNATRRLFRKDESEKLNHIPVAAETIAETMQSQGYKTFALTDNGNICHGLGFHQGFDKFHNFELKRATAAGIEKKLFEWEQEIKSQDKYFLYLHYMDPHSPYNKRKPWFKPGSNNQETIINSYDSEIRYVDEHLKVLFERFEWDKDTLVVITSDHGEEFWEHGKLGHGKALYLESIHVPLIFYSSTPLIKPIRVNNWVSVLDIAPTFREFFGLDKLPKHSGRSLMPALQGSSLPEGEPLLAEIWKRLPNGKKVEQYAMTSSNWRYFQERKGNWETKQWNPKVAKELYDVAADWGEQKNLVKKHPDRVTQYAGSISGVLETHPTYERQLAHYDFSKKIEFAQGKTKGKKKS